MDYIEYCLWLVMAFGTANYKIWKLLQEFDDPEAAYNSLKNGGCDFLSEKERHAVKTTHLNQCEAVEENCRKKGIMILSFYSENYPKQLRDISNPPLIIFAKGDLSVLDELCITVVGTRNPSPYSLKAAERICSELARLGVVLASGFALGIDSVVHRSAVKNGSRTIAVLGCGIDVDYPRENAGSKKAISDHGLFISEFFPGTKPFSANFPKRNRLLSGISSGTLVVEASQRSGSLITAEFAVEQGKDLFCIPPADIFDERYSGVIKFLRDGAMPVFSHLDIVYVYYRNFAHKLSALNESADYYESVSESSVFKHERTVKKSSAEGNSGKSRDVREDDAPKSNQVMKDYGELDDDSRKIIMFLKDGARLIDEIADFTGDDIPPLTVKLTEMEMDGIVRCLPGRKYELS